MKPALSDKLQYLLAHIDWAKLRALGLAPAVDVRLAFSYQMTYTDCLALRKVFESNN